LTREPADSRQEWHPPVSRAGPGPEAGDSVNPAFSSSVGWRVRHALSPAETSARWKRCLRIRE